MKVPVKNVETKCSLFLVVSPAVEMVVHIVYMLSIGYTTTGTRPMRPEGDGLQVDTSYASHDDIYERSSHVELFELPRRKGDGRSNRLPCSPGELKRARQSNKTLEGFRSKRGAHLVLHTHPHRFEPINATSGRDS